VNTFGVHVLRYLNNTSILLHSAGVTSVAIAVLAKAPTHQSAKFVFGTFYDGTGIPPAVGWSVRASPAYVACCGALLSQYTLTGFDASAHLSEETRKASWSAPIGVISSVGFSSLFGLFVILSFLFSIQDFATTVTGGAFDQPVLQIFADVFGDDGAVVLMCLIMICVWHCGLFSMTSNSRMMFAFSRDGGIVSPLPSCPISITHADNIVNSQTSSTKSTTNSAPPSAPSGSPPSLHSASRSPLSAAVSPSQPQPRSQQSVSTSPTESQSSSDSSMPEISTPERAPSI
jgi:amino acid transporter